MCQMSKKERKSDGREKEKREHRHDKTEKTPQLKVGDAVLV